jgi:hypothetical protein
VLNVSNPIETLLPELLNAKGSAIEILIGVAPVEL